MLTLWYADFSGTEKELDRVNELLDRAAKEAGVGMKRMGPYLTQGGADYLWVFEMEKFEDMSLTGRRFLRMVQKEKLPLTPMRYEVAVTPREFWG